MFVINYKLSFLLEDLEKKEQENFPLCQEFSFDGSWKNIDAFL